MTYRGIFEGLLGDHIGEVEGGEPRGEGGARVSQALLWF